MNRSLLIAILLCAGLTMFAQEKLTVDKVYAAYLRNSGSIMENNQIKGYYFLYQSDKIDKRTNEYTLQILDQNLNKVKDIKFQDSKEVSLLEAAYNGSTLGFLFKNEDTKTLDMKIYDLDGKLKYSYSRGYDKKTEDLMKQYQTMHTDEGMNQNVFDLGTNGFASVLPLREGKNRTYEVDFYSSINKKQWTYTPMDEERFAQAEMLGSTDSMVILTVMKKSRALSGQVTAHLVGLNFVTRKKEFEIDAEAGEQKFMPSSVKQLKDGKIMVLGAYYDKEANIAKDASLGMAIFEIDGKGKILKKTLNTWAGDFAKYLPTNSKGKIDNVGYLYVHRMIQTPDGKTFLVGEGYKRNANAGGIALTVLAAAAGGGTSAGVTKIVVTDMVVMELNSDYKVTNATIYDKTQNTAEASTMSDYNSQHAIAMYLKAMGAFDYEFTVSNADNSNFAICYNDYVKSKEYKGQTFNAIRYNGSKFSTDKIELKSKASSLRVFPGKSGFIMILEYYKKDKRLEMRLEKLS
jgi:uncharacterized protein DUF6770